MAASSSSSGGAGGGFRVGLWSTDGKTKLYDVDVVSPTTGPLGITPIPPLLFYQGNYYVHSPFYQSRYVQQVPVTPNPDLGAPPLSVLAFPQF